MIVNIFSIPLIIGNIDCSKIKINNKGFNEKWLSKTKTSFGFKNQLTKESEDYLLNVLSKNLIQFFKKLLRLHVITPIPIFDIIINIYK